MNPRFLRNVLTPVVLIPAFVVVGLATIIAITQLVISQTPPAAPPAMPIGVTVSSETHHAVTIRWTDPQDDSIIGYEILRQSKDHDGRGYGLGATAFVVISDVDGTMATEYIDTSVSPGTEYVYSVEAWNVAGVSERSSYVTAATPGGPTQPRGLTAISEKNDPVTSK